MQQASGTNTRSTAIAASATSLHTSQHTWLFSASGKVWGLLTPLLFRFLSSSNHSHAHLGLFSRVAMIITCRRHAPVVLRVHNRQHLCQQLCAVVAGYGSAPQQPTDSTVRTVCGSACECTGADRPWLRHHAQAESKASAVHLIEMTAGMLVATVATVSLHLSASAFLLLVSGRLCQDFMHVLKLASYA